MILIIGGASQGKSGYAQNRFPGAVIRDKGIPDMEIIADDTSGSVQIIESFNSWAEELIKAGADPFPQIRAFLEHFPETVIITDSVGCGIVPVDKADRNLRERIGRLQCALADEAEEVIRVICGIGQKIK